MSKKKKTSDSNVLSENRIARHNYFFHSELEAGIKLKGWEAVAMKQRNFSIKEAYITFKNGECFLSGCTVHPNGTVAFSGTEEDKIRDKKLLLHKNEIDKLRSSVDRDGATVIPFRVYISHGLVKIKIAEATGKKLHDKRKAEANRDWGIQKQRLLKNSI